MSEILKFLAPTTIGVESFVFSSPVGLLRVTGSDEALQAVVRVEGVSQSEEPFPAWAANVRDQLLRYFEGKQQTFDFPLAPGGTPFQQRVWQVLLSIPLGKTCSYLELARRLGDEKTIRAAGRANGSNPIAIIIPCHRVIGSDGSLTGYAGGLRMKKDLLDHESRMVGNYQMNFNF